MTIDKELLQDLGAILRAMGGMVFGAGLLIMIADAFLTLPTILSSNAMTGISLGIFAMIGGFAFKAIFGE